MSTGDHVEASLPALTFPVLMSAALAPLGLLGILDQQHARGRAPAVLADPMLRMDEHDDLRLAPTFPGVDALTAAITIRDHADEVTGHGGWATATAHGIPLFGARQHEPTDWDKTLSARRKIVDRMIGDGRTTDLDLIDALGVTVNGWAGRRVAPWMALSSPWDMTPRQRGDNVLTSRILPLGRAVAAVPTPRIIRALTGRSTELDRASLAPPSTMDMGFHAGDTPDVLTAWLALWGLAAFPTQVRPTGRIHHPGHIGHLGSGRYAIPAPLRAMRWRDLQARLEDVTLAAITLDDTAPPGVLGSPVHPRPPRAVAQAALERCAHDRVGVLAFAEQLRTTGPSTNVRATRGVWVPWS